VINLRSDTQTLPTRRMYEAMASAPIGDDTYFEDPTVLRLEERVAALMGMESAMLVLSGTMANLVALMTWCRPGDELFVDEHAHVVNSEAGGYAAVAGVVPHLVEGERGHPLPLALRRSVLARDVHRPRPRLMWLENTNNRAGGTVMTVDHHREITAAARDASLNVHLDGARIFNAACVLGVEPDRLTTGVDSVYVDLTKGLACPMGALLAGPADFIQEARHVRRRIGGGMRQAGVFAACGMVALDDLVDRLDQDHALARWLAERIAEIEGFAIDPATVETNIVNVDVSALGEAGELAAAFADEGLLVTARPPGGIRLVTHLQVTRQLAEVALRVLEDVATAQRAIRSNNRS
jgi:threonine aldolase